MLDEFKPGTLHVDEELCRCSGIYKEVLRITRANITRPLSLKGVQQVLAGPASHGAPRNPEREDFAAEQLPALF